MKLPFESESFYGMIDRIRSKDPLKLPDTISPLIRQLIKILLDKNPKTRPRAASLLKKDIIRKYVKTTID